MLLRLILAELRHRPGRAIFLLGGYSLGVAVMVVLLAVGEAMLGQARNRSLVGGGDLIVVPAGISAEMLRSGSVEEMFLGIDQARFLQREVFEGERGRDEYGIRAASPILEGKRLVVQAGGADYPVIASGEIPSRARAAGASPNLLAGHWSDSDADRRWVAPTPDELYRSIDRFHLPTGAAARDSTWAEWHYFNVVLGPDRWLYLTFMVGGRMADEQGRGGRLLLTLREPDGSHRSSTRDFPSDAVRMDTLSPDLRFGTDSRVQLVDGTYRILARLDDATLDLTVSPTPHRFFPPTDLGGSSLVSGYVVPALHAEASGTVCLPRCRSVTSAQAYHDHNWGIWRDVSWEWGAASGPRMSLLYGVVRGDTATDRGLFVYLVDEKGPVGIYRPDSIRVTATQAMTVNGRSLRVPRSMTFDDPGRGLTVTLDVDAVHVTDLERSRDRYFLQMRGTARVIVGGTAESLTGFFETYLDE